jgi:hypothetical protein
LYKPWANLKSQVTQTKNNINLHKDLVPEEKMLSLTERYNKFEAKYIKITESKDKKDINSLI